MEQPINTDWQIKGIESDVGLWEITDDPMGHFNFNFNTVWRLNFSKNYYNDHCNSFTPDGNQ